VLSIRTPVDTSRPSRTTQKAGPDSAGAVRASTNVVGVVHLKPLFPEQIQTSLSTPFEVGAHLRFDHGDLAQSQGPLCGGVSNVVGCCEKNTAAWALSRQSTQHGVWIPRFVTHWSPQPHRGAGGGEGDLVTVWTTFLAFVRLTLRV
jgi:hypothetical protein